MKFNEYEYIRPDYNIIKEKYLNLINDFKNWNQQNKIIAILIICAILILTLNSFTIFSSTDSYYSDDSDTSSYGSYSYDNYPSHYRGVDTSPDTIAKNDPDSYYDYYEYGDNEGLLSTLPALTTTFTGVLTGKLLKSSKNQIFKLKWMLISGFVALTLGILWNFSFPINKILWTITNRKMERVWFGKTTNTPKEATSLMQRGS